MWPNARMGEELKENIMSCIYASQNGEFLHSSMRGVDDCNDFGRISINSAKLYTKNNV